MMLSFFSSLFSKKLLSQYFAGVVLVVVALPLSLGIALASKAPLFSGMLGAIVGGLVVGVISSSGVSVSGPSAALAALVVQTSARLHSFEAFLLALVLAGFFQIILGVVRGGFIAEFFPSSVIKGLLAATGLLIVFKQIPHLVGYDFIQFGDDAFWEEDGRNTFSEIGNACAHYQLGALAVGVICLVLLIVWEKNKRFKKTSIAAPLFIVLMAVWLHFCFRKMGGAWVISPSHLVQVPAISSITGLWSSLSFPDWKQLSSPVIYGAALMLAASASLETLLNLEATQKIDPEQRLPSPNRELVAQGLGNMLLGLIGGIPITCAIVRSRANVDAGGRTKIAAITHGVILLGCLLFLSRWLNEIPLAALASVLIVLGAKLASPKLFVSIWKEGPQQFFPFLITIVAILLTNLLFGVLIGLGVGLLFIFHSNLKPPMHQIVERHASGDVLRIELASQLNFLNRPFLMKMFDEMPSNTHLLLDARCTDYIDPDIFSLIQDYLCTKAKVRNVTVSLLGFKDNYPKLRDQIRFIDYSTQEVQSNLKPEQVVGILKEGNKRFYEGRPLRRDYQRQVQNTSQGQYPMGVVLSCIDSRAPVEMIFDAGLGDLFSIRIAGNVANEKELASMEYACLVAGAKLILVLGHSSCGAVRAAVDFFQKEVTANIAIGSQHLNHLLAGIQQCIDPVIFSQEDLSTESKRKKYVDELARANVLATMRAVHQQSHALNRLAQEGKILIVGAFYDVGTGKIEWM
ncbi:MAG: hypothetical protein K2W99_06310 [Chthoniobacterales bacterium]|nr:hypothetical protein [Chthoniobacterales bacterium]